MAHRLQDGKSHGIKLRLRVEADHRKPPRQSGIPARQETGVGSREPEGEEPTGSGSTHLQNLPQGLVADVAVNGFGSATGAGRCQGLAIGARRERAQ